MRADLARLKRDSDSGKAASPELIGPAKAMITRRRAVWISSFAALLVAVIVGVTVWSLRPSPSTSTLPQPMTRFAIPLQPGPQLSGPGGIAGLETSGALAVSPDGRYIAYAAARGPTQQIFL